MIAMMTRRGWRELPPRTRRIPGISTTTVGIFGTTSAYAENTAHGSYEGLREGNYLRVRGEYQEKNTRKHKAYGTTSAYAENTGSDEFSPKWYWNYLRVRGEYPK